MADSKNMIAGLYDLGETIGEGHYAVVKLARHVFTGEKVAVKVIDKMKLDQSTRTQMMQEVRLMKLVQHPNVVRLYEVRGDILNISNPSQDGVNIAIIFCPRCKLDTSPECRRVENIICQFPGNWPPEPGPGLAPVHLQWTTLVDHSK